MNGYTECAVLVIYGEIHTQFKISYQYQARHLSTSQLTSTRIMFSCLVLLDTLELHSKLLWTKKPNQAQTKKKPLF